MMIRRLHIVTTVCLLIMSIAAKTDAQQAGKSEPIAPAKRALLKELFELTKVDKMMQNMMDAFLLQLEKDTPATLDQATRDPASDPKDQEELNAKIIESSNRLSRRLREVLPQRVNFAEVAEEMFYPLYDKYFTEQELKDIVGFYRSAAGQKTIQVLPQLLQESMQQSSAVLMPKITPIVNELIEEERQRLLKERKKPKDKSTTDGDAVLQRKF